MTETFTRDSDKRKFETYNQNDDFIVIREIEPPKPDRIKKMIRDIWKEEDGTTITPQGLTVYAARLTVECVLAILKDRGVLKDE